MEKMPWVRFFASDWLAGTRGMSAAETGVYITLIATMYERQEPIPEDITRLARLCGASNSSFKKIIELLINDEKIIRVDGGLWNERVEKERVYLSEKSEVGSRAAKARWGKKHNENNGQNMPTQCEGNANAMPFQKPDTRVVKELTTFVPKTAKKGCRIPEDFRPDLEWSQAQGLSNSELKFEFEQFKDFWKAKSGEKASKLDWQATWRSWIRNSQKRKADRQPKKKMTEASVWSDLARERGMLNDDEHDNSRPLFQTGHGNGSHSVLDATVEPSEQGLIELDDFTRSLLRSS